MFIVEVLLEGVVFDLVVVNRRQGVDVLFVDGDGIAFIVVLDVIIVILAW